MSPAADDDVQIHAHADMVFRTCLRLTGNAQDAADVSQEVFIAWMQSKGTITGSVGAWLHGTARLRSLEFLRRSHRRVNHERQADSPQAQSPDASWRDHLDAALAELDGPSRALVVEYHLMGAEQADLATRLRCTQATVSRRLTKAMSELRALLERRGVTVAPSVVPLWFAKELVQPCCPKELVAPLLAQAHVVGSASMLGHAHTQVTWKVWFAASAAVAVLIGGLTLKSLAITANVDAPSRVRAGTDTPGDPSKRLDGFVHRFGRYLAVDSKPIHLHGGSFYGAPWRQADFRAYVDTWLTKAQGNGMNTIRIVDFLETSKPEWRNDKTWQNMDYILGALAAHQMFAIVDLSTYRNMLEQTNGKDKNQESIGAAYNPARWKDFTTFVASRYQRNTAIAYYSIAGECEAPVHQRITTAGLTDFFAQVSTQLHDADPNHQISSGGLEFLDWDAGIDWKAIFSLPHIQMASVHVYSKGDMSVLPTIAEWARQPSVNLPFVFEEFGIKQGTDDPARAAAFRNIYGLGSRYSSVGALFWNLGPELGEGSCDVGPQTPTVWTAARGGETWFHSGFEDGDALPIQTGASATLQVTAAGPPQPTCLIITGGSRNGDKALRIASTVAPQTPYARDLYRVDLPIRPTTTLSYWINPVQDSGRYIAIDLHCTDGTWLHDSAAVDQRGVSVQAKAGHGGELPLNAWSEVRCTVGTWLNGKMVDAIVVSYDHAAASGPFTCQLDDLSLANEQP